MTKEKTKEQLAAEKLLEDIKADIQSLYNHLIKLGKQNIENINLKNQLSESESRISALEDEKSNFEEKIKELQDELGVKDRNLLEAKAEADYNKQFGDIAVQDKAKAEQEKKTLKQQVEDQQNTINQLQEALKRHTEDKSKHIRRFNGDEGYNTQRAKEVNNKRGLESVSKVIAGVRHYLNSSYNEDRLVDMAWLEENTKLKESQIRDIIKAVSEGQIPLPPGDARLTEWLKQTRQFKNTKQKIGQ